jgi:hypothetical protein
MTPGICKTAADAALSTTIEDYTKKLHSVNRDYFNNFIGAVVKLRAFIKNAVGSDDHIAFGYESRDKFIEDIILEIIDTHLQDDDNNDDDGDDDNKGKPYYRVCRNCEYGGDDDDDNHMRKIVTLKQQYVCTKCNGLFNESDDDDDDNDDDNVFVERAIRLLQEIYNKNNLATNNNHDSDDADADDHNNINDGCSTIKQLSVSKWTIIKFVTEIALLVRCWVWGLCDKPWYILWNKNKDKAL